MQKRLSRTSIHYVSPIFMLWLLVLLNQPPSTMATPMNLTQIRDMAVKSSAAVKNSSLQQFKAIFKEIAPDTWVTTMNEIPLQTIQCMIKIGKRIALKVQNNMTTEPTPAQMTNKMRKNCKNGYPKVAAFENAVNKTIQQLPQSVKNIGSQFSSQFKQLSTYLENGNFTAASPIGVSFLKSVANISMADRQQMGTLFPKISTVFVDPRVNDLINMTIFVLNGNSSLIKNVTDLAQAIFFEGVRKNGNTTNSTSSFIMMSPVDFSSKQSSYFGAPETFVQSNTDEISSGPIKMLAVLKGNDSHVGMIEPIAHGDAGGKMADETVNRHPLALNVLPTKSVSLQTHNEAVKGPQHAEEVSFLPRPPTIYA